MSIFSIPCPPGAHDSDERHADYYPLTKAKIADLLYTAQQAKLHGFIKILSDVSCCLCQGIVGQVCPHPSDGRLTEKTNELYQLFYENYMRGPDPVLVDQMYAIMTEP